jgi:hypothetical protein
MGILSSVRGILGFGGPHVGLTSEAHADTSSDINRLAAIGGFTVSWAAVELVMDRTNELIIGFAGGSAIGDQVPVSLKPKIAFYRKAHQQLETLAPFSAAGVDLAQRVADMTETRHDMIHGFAVGELTDGKLKVLRHTFVGARVFQRAKAYSTRDIVRLASKAATLATDLLLHVDRLGKLIDSQNSTHDL